MITGSDLSEQGRGGSPRRSLGALAIAIPYDDHPGSASSRGGDNCVAYTIYLSSTLRIFCRVRCGATGSHRQCCEGELQGKRNVADRDLP